MNALRQLLTILLIPLYLYAGAFLSEWLSRTFGIWHMYASAFVLPFIGLVSTYFIAPYFKVYNLLFIYIVGLILAYWLAYPAQYPEGSAHPYQWTYRPFALTVMWSTILLAGCLFQLKRKKQ
ncbi:hypothetical protein [Undibacterium sp. Ji22W]|uniref:hypothetical protein n=1 Tax=Undibacterium sp. Ji22W TaxID=3413038 RepID=UPI003BF3DAF5